MIALSVVCRDRIPSSLPQHEPSSKLCSEKAINRGRDQSAEIAVTRDELGAIFKVNNCFQREKLTVHEGCYAEHMRGSTVKTVVTDQFKYECQKEGLAEMLLFVS